MKQLKTSSPVPISTKTPKKSPTPTLSGLSILLQGDAFTWWMGVKSTITTWENAKKAIRDEFAPRPPAHRIYQMIFETKQDANTPTGLFIAQKRALLAQVTPPDSESRQLDFLYGLLRQEIKDKIPRTSIATFYELLVKARDVEGTLQERKKEKVRPNDENGRNRCEYCHNFGHTMKDCRKKAKRGEPHNRQPNPTMLLRRQTIQTLVATDAATRA
jgi:hypothetical protein